jgi:hypothetical protein
MSKGRWGPDPGRHPHVHEGGVPLRPGRRANPRLVQFPAQEKNVPDISRKYGLKYPPNKMKIGMGI